MALLSKSDVERLLGTYDDDPIGALTGALRVVLDAPHLGWTELVDAADLLHSRRLRLHTLEPAALDELARELNETRTVTSGR